jgi:hypothetical protein
LRRSVGSALTLATVYWLLSAAPTAAATMEPGLWRFTQSTQGGGRARAKTTTRCVSAAQAGDPARFFQPLGRGCVLNSHSGFGSRITSTFRCSHGDGTTDVTSVISFASASEMSISTTMSVTSPRGTASAVLTGSGKRIGNCGGGRKRR